jgi:DNA-binding SARP family transcriptional activator
MSSSAFGSDSSFASHAVTRVETTVDTVCIQMLGVLKLRRGGEMLALPASRKVRALLAYLALAPRPLARSRLCELLWDSAADPRGGLRWCLSKIRGLLDGESQRRVRTRNNMVEIDIADCFVDALAILRAAKAGIATLTFEQQRRLEALFEGEFLEGLDMCAIPLFDGWLAAQRRRFRALHAALLEELAKHASEDEAFEYLEKWRELEPFDPRVHETYLAALARYGRLREGEAHVGAAIRLFEAEGLDAAPVRHAWRSVREQTARELGTPRVAAPEAASRRPSIAVMPFVDRSPEALARGGPADAVAHDLATRLAKLRSLFVIAPGTAFALHERGIGAEDAGRMLGIDYIVSGSARVRNGRCTVAVELSETRGARIVWAEAYERNADDTLLVLDEIGNRIVASIGAEIDNVERNRAILKPPNSLDAWEACHRGLWHMYRYRKDDNDKARHFFEMALKLDPTFSRAYAGLSFTHFQDAFQNWETRAPHMDKAYETAAQAIMADERDPAAHWAMGRALYLRRRWEESEAELARSVDLSPSFALGHYNLSFLRSVVGDPRVAIADAELSRELSPYDPMLFGMLATRAMALVRVGGFEEAADWAVKAASRPNAFAHIHAIAAYTLALAGALDEARAYAAAVRRSAPRYDISQFLLTFPFEPQGEAIFRKGAGIVGMA